jgi:hypothetical protein
MPRLPLSVLLLFTGACLAQDFTQFQAATEPAKLPNFSPPPEIASAREDEVLQGEGEALQDGPHVTERAKATHESADRIRSLVQDFPLHETSSGMAGSSMEWEGEAPPSL